LVGAILYRHID